MKEVFYIEQEKIISFITKITKKLNLKKKDNNFLIKSLVGSSMRGVDSHGIRLLPHYLKCLEQGRINISPKMTFKLNMPSVGLLDADNGLGHSAAYLGSIKATDIAKKNGVGIVGIINSSHYGAAGAYSLDIAEKGFIGLCFTHSDALGIPFNGYKKFHGTNPYSFSAPLKKRKPLLVDFSTTLIPWNKVARAKNNKNKLVKGVAMDKKGNITRDPDLAKTLVPLGGKYFGHKGFGLSASIEILCGPFLGMLHGLRLLPMKGPNFTIPRKLGHFVMAINIKSIVSKKKYFLNIENYIKDLKKQKSINDKILYPGEKEWLEEINRQKTGVPFDLELKQLFLKISKKYKVNLF